MKKILISICALLTTIPTLSTMQLAERLYLNGKNYAIADYFFPMETYLKNNNLKLEIELLCSALWRGYIGEYVIRDNKLFFIGAYEPDFDTLEKKQSYSVGYFTKNSQDKELFCKWANTTRAIPLSLTSCTCCKGALDEDNISMRVKDGIVSMTSEPMPYRNISIEDLNRRKGVKYVAEYDAPNTWYDLNLLDCRDYKNPPRVYPNSYYISEEEYSAIMGSKTIKTRGIFICANNAKNIYYYRLSIPCTRTTYRGTIYLIDSRDLKNYDRKHVEIEITNPFVAPIKIINIRELFSYCEFVFKVGINRVLYAKNLTRP